MMNIRKENEDGSVTLTTTYSKERVDAVVHGYGIREQNDKTKALVEAWFITAGFEVEEVFELSNQYCGYGLDDGYYRMSGPWWLVLTNVGKIVLGPRKRVWSIQWDRTDIRGIVTEDDVTKDETGVHSYSYADTVKYLAELYKLWDTERIQKLRAKHDAEREAEVEA